MGVGVDVMRRRGQGGCTAAKKRKRGEQVRRMWKIAKKKKFPGPAVAGSNTVHHTSGSPGAISASRMSV